MTYREDLEALEQIIESVAEFMEVEGTDGDHFFNYIDSFKAAVAIYDAGWRPPVPEEPEESE